MAALTELPRPSEELRVRQLLPEYTGILKRQEAFHDQLLQAYRIKDFRSDAPLLFPRALFERIGVPIQNTGSEPVMGYEYGEVDGETIDDRTKNIAKSAGEYFRQGNGTVPDKRVLLPCLVDAGVAMTIGLWETMPDVDPDEIAQRTFDLTYQTANELFLDHPSFTRARVVHSQESQLREMFFEELDYFAEEIASQNDKPGEEVSTTMGLETMDGNSPSQTLNGEYPFFFNRVHVRAVKGKNAEGNGDGEAVGYYAEVTLLDPTQDVDSLGAYQTSVGHSFGQNPNECLDDAFRQAVKGIYPDVEPEVLASQTFNTPDGNVVPGAIQQEVGNSGY